MKKFIVIGNPIKHSLSPNIHNFWFQSKKIKAIYEKKLIEQKDLPIIVEELKNEKISGVNVTVPFKKAIIPFLDELSISAKKVQSVNTVYKKNNKIVGDNTDIGGFEGALLHINYKVAGKKVLILGAGGVVTSLIYSLFNSGAGEITISNRTKTKSEAIKKIFTNIQIIDWGKVNEFDIIINATSLGLNSQDKIDLDYKKHNNKLFYDIIYNPSETYFLKKAKEAGNQTENGRLMFIYQAKLAFELWHDQKVEIDKDVVNLF